MIYRAIYIDRFIYIGLGRKNGHVEKKRRLKTKNKKPKRNPSFIDTVEVGKQKNREG